MGQTPTQGLVHLTSRGIGKAHARAVLKTIAEHECAYLLAIEQRGTDHIHRLLHSMGVAGTTHAPPDQALHPLRKCHYCAHVAMRLFRPADGSFSTNEVCILCATKTIHTTESSGGTRGKTRLVKTRRSSDERRALMIRLSSAQEVRPAPTKQKSGKTSGKGKAKTTDNRGQQTPAQRQQHGMGGTAGPGPPATLSSKKPGGQRKRFAHKRKRSGKGASGGTN